MEEKKEEKNDWLVNLKGNPETRMWEISICKRHNGTGRNGYGYWSSEKILVSKSDGQPCNEEIFDGLMTLAYHHAIFLNRRDGYEEVPGEIVDDKARKIAAKKKVAKRKK